ncbi:MAG TPA: dipeptidase [Gemmatimonadales bacterium]|jgi:acetylornithine deacetylase/succinyl-diaminopimelate desuccinylase-like protein|nr:dipeptidase [Gemmatimonadales bacterium]
MDRDKLVRELNEFLRIPSVSTLPAHDADCRAAAEWVAAELRRLGCRDVEFLGSEMHPVVWGVGPDVPGAPTLLIYGHYDVQPPDPLAEWTTPPFEPTVRDGRLYARGAADDKGQVFCLLKAIEAAGAARPPVNFRFLIEGEEEFGSKVLFDLLKREPHRTKADAVLVADMAYVAPGWPAVYSTLRGLCYAEITVRTAKSDLHSGEYGGAAPNAHEELARLLTRLKGEDGRINIPGFYAAVKPPTKAERTAWRKLPFKERDFLARRVQAKALTGMKQYPVLERLWALPTFEIHGILGGFTGQGAKTVIPAEATAKVSLRLVPNQTLKTVQKQVAAAVKRVAPTYVTATVRFLHGADPAQIKVDGPAFKLLDRAFTEVVGRGTVPARAGGSIPVVPALGASGAPVILTGIGLPDDRLHAPDEKLELKQLWDGIAVFRRFYELLGT